MRDSETRKIVEASTPSTINNTPSNLIREHEFISFMYADLIGSSAMVEEHQPEMVAETIATFLMEAAKIVHALGGVCHSYDGDRIMAVFHTNQGPTQAVLAAFYINAVMELSVIPHCQKSFGISPQHAIGIDAGKALAVKSGLPRPGVAHNMGNDVSYVGKAANYAARNSGIRINDEHGIDKQYRIYVSDEAFQVIKPVKCWCYNCDVKNVHPDAWDSTLAGAHKTALTIRTPDILAQNKLVQVWEQHTLSDGSLVHCTNQRLYRHAEP